VKSFFLIPILITAVILSGLPFNQAFAHTDASACNSVAAGSGLTAYNAANSPIGSVVQGQAVYTIQDLSVLPDNGSLIRCAFDGGTLGGFVGSIEITNPDGSLVGIKVNDGNIPCLDGTTNTGDLVLPQDCGTPLSTFSSAHRDYTVNCSDDTKNGDPKDGNLRWKAVFTGRAHSSPTDTTPIQKIDTIDLLCKPAYTAKTDSSTKGSTAGPISNPTDLVTITGLDGFAGTFTVSAVLNGPSGPVDTPTCPSVSSIGPDHLYTISTTCTTSATGDLAPGDYCWNVTITETGGNYSPSIVTKTGTNDKPNECFTIKPPYTAKTDSSTKGSTAGPISNPTDLVTITGVDHTAGTFTVSAVLNGPSGPVDTPTCPSVSSIGPDHLYTISTTCTTSATGDLAPGDYCWNVTITETGGNYSPSIVTKTGTNDKPNECFTIAVKDYTVSTLSSTKGSTAGPISNPTDLVTITGVDGTSGTFETDAVLVGPGNTQDNATCTPSPETTDAFDLIVTCNLDNPTDFTEQGQYCWNVTVTEIGDNYGSNSDGTFSGSKDSQHECFTIEGPSGFFVGGGRVDVPAPVLPDNTVVKATGKGPTPKVTPTTFKLTHGFELHCDAASGPNNLEINWLQSQFHLEELETATCIDDGSTNEPPPSTNTKPNGPGPTLDIYQGFGYGRYNGVCGASAQWNFDDNGEPGKADQIVALVIKDKDSNIVLSINPGQLGVTSTAISGTWKNPGDDSAFPWLNLVTGNHQWVPHKTGTHGPTQTNPCPQVTP
jgi:hypothetical protein